MIINENRTENYIGTVNLLDEFDQKWIKTIRGVVKETNAHMKATGSEKRNYVKLQGRGHRRGEKRYNQSLPLSYATVADVYVYPRFPWLDR